MIPSVLWILKLLNLVDLGHYPEGLKRDISLHLHLQFLIFSRMIFGPLQKGQGNSTMKLQIAQSNSFL